MKLRFVLVCCALCSLGCTAEVNELEADTSAGEEVRETVQALDDCEGGWTAPTRSGQRIKAPDSNRVYVIDPYGYKRWIASAAVYEALYGSGPGAWSGIVTDKYTRCILEAKSLLSTRKLVKMPHRPEVYLYDGWQIHWIVSVEAFNHYGFAWNKIETLDGVWFDPMDDDVGYWF